MVNTRTFSTSNLAEFIDAFQPFAIGMDQTLKDLYNFNARTMNTGSYPPYNIVTIDDDHFSIEMAIAGFGEDDLEVSQKDENLVIKGEIKKSEEDTYLHKGIANRSFTRQFKLGTHVQVKACDLKNGMLVIHLEKVIPEEEKPKVIPINK
tara:strand:- start:2708 stop:3157 length:450 start_codon:yes stop_codon:yes gene_type:complete